MERMPSGCSLEDKTADEPTRFPAKNNQINSDSVATDNQ